MTFPKIPSSPKLLYPLLGIGITAIVSAIITTALLIGRNYSQRLEQNSTRVRQIESKTPEFAVNKITIKRNGEIFEFYGNGLVVSFDEKTPQLIKNRRFISNSRLAALFGKLTKETFTSLATNYYSKTDNFVIVIETTQGTKDIIINDQGLEPPPDIIDDIIDDTDDVIDDLDDPPSPPPSISPTPAPSASATPAPSTAPTPTPTPATGGPPIPIDPFTCDMLQNQINDVTVNNTVCLPD